MKFRSIGNNKMRTLVFNPKDNKNKNNLFYVTIYNRTNNSGKIKPYIFTGYTKDLSFKTYSLKEFNYLWQFLKSDLILIEDKTLIFGADRFGADQ